jgi:metal-dependent HD superfamily phosphatase/phosphodiesterase
LLAFRELSYEEYGAAKEARGTIKNSLKIAANLLKKGFPPEEVAELVELSPDEVKKIQQ